MTNLTATNLSLFELMPVRWFKKRKRGRGQKETLRVPPGTRLVLAPNDPPYIDASRVGYRIRAATLKFLAKKFPEEFRRRMGVEIRRLFN